MICCAPVLVPRNLCATNVPMADAGINFADRLNLALKALSIGRGRLAADIGVDKSMISRWLGGTARPSAHNIERLTRLIAGHAPGFSLLDWEGDLASFSRRLGVAGPDADAAPPPPPLSPPLSPLASPAAGTRLCHPGNLPFGSLDAAAAETQRRAAAYAGRWRITRLRSSGILQPVVEYALIRPDGDGLMLEVLFETHRLRGWLLVSNGTLYSFVSDSGDDSFAYYCLNGVVGPRANVIDGIHCSVGGHRTTTPFAQAIVMERIGDLEGEAADAAWADAAMARWSEVPADSLVPEVFAAITRDFGRTPAAAGGEAILRVPIERSLASGGY